jgi:hypothetical protein
MWLYPVPIGTWPGRGGGACNRELPRIPILGSRVNKRSEGHLTREGCRAKGPWAMERRRSATRSIHNNCVALAIL